MNAPTQTASQLCERPGCYHSSAVHQYDTGACQVTSCLCWCVVSTPPSVHPSGPSRRISIDVPEGYMLTVSLVPYAEGVTIETTIDDAESGEVTA